MKIEAWSDGSATSEGKPGGYGWVLVVDGEKVDQGSGYMESASNNDAELLGSIKALEAAYNHYSPLNESEVTLISDSKLVLGWASGEYKFKQLDKLEKYDKLRNLMTYMCVKTQWVKGHSKNEINDLCDKLANNARLKLSNEIEDKEKKAKGETLIGKRKTGIVCFYYKDQLKVVDFSKNIVENYDRELHGSRGGVLEIREEKTR